jgi:hypothetical protein
MSLFDERPAHIAAMNRYETAAALVPELRAAAQHGGKALEAHLAALQTRADDFPDLHRALMAVRYYLRDICGGPIQHWFELAGTATNYGTLLHQVMPWARERDEEVCFVTFNYDALMQHAVRAVLDIDIRGMDDYVADPRLKLIHPHGHVNWVEKVDNADPSQPDSPYYRIREAADLSFTEQYYYGTADEHDGTRSPSIPALAIPVDATKKFVLPPSHFREMQRCIGEATRILVVGWSAAETHFLAELRTAAGVTSTCIVDASKEAIGNVRTNLRQGGMPDPAVSTGFPGGFSRFTGENGFRRWVDGELVGDPEGNSWPATR